MLYEEKPPEVTLLSYTPDPLSTFYEVWNRSRDIPIILKGQMGRREAEVDIFRRIVFDFTQIPEMVRFTFWLEGVPRSFFDQLVRHRKVAWFARSQRIRDCSNFYDDGDYLTTPEIVAVHGPSPGKEGYAQSIYQHAMKGIQYCYQRLLAAGVPSEDARGILPLHIRTGLAVSLTVRDLSDMFRSRTCHLLQQTYWAPIAQQMKSLLEGIDPELAVVFSPPCRRPEQMCVSPVEAIDRIEKNLGHHESGEHRHDLHPCRIFHDQYALDMLPPEDVGKVVTMVRDGVTKWAHAPFECKNG